LKQRVKELRGHIDAPHKDIEEAYLDLDWSIHYLQWLVQEQPKID